MSDKRTEKDLRKDADRIIKDINTLVGDSAVGINRMEDNFLKASSKAKDEIVNWAEDGASQLSSGFEKVSGNVKESISGMAANVSKDVNRGFGRYNKEAQKVADKIPGGFSESAARYPWVIVSLGLALGLFLGVLLKPTRHLKKTLPVYSIE